MLVYNHKMEDNKNPLFSVYLRTYHQSMENIAVFQTEQNQ